MSPETVKEIPSESFGLGLLALTRMCIVRVEVYVLLLLGKMESSNMKPVDWNLELKLSGPFKTESLFDLTKAKTVMAQAEDHTRTNVKEESNCVAVFAAQSRKKYGPLCPHVLRVLKKYDLPSVNYTKNTTNGTGNFIIHLDTRYVREVTTKVFTEYCLANDVKVVCNERCCKVAFNAQPRAWHSQSLYTSMVTGLEKLVSTLTAATNNVRIAMSLNFRLLLLDILALIIEVREGFLTFGKFFAILLRLYTTYKRFDTMKPETLSTSDLLLGFSLLGLPASIVDRMKTFTALTGQRVFDADLMATLLYKFFSLMKDVVGHFESSTILGGPSRYLLSFLEWCGSNFFDYGLMTEVASIYTTWVRSPQSIFDPAYREKATLHYEKCLASHSFLQYADNVRNKHFNVTWTLYKESLMKSIKAFEASRRNEPICIVFEGQAGSGKSTMMNNFVDLLRAAGKSVYCHTVPSTEDAKDFYDDYENQEVFVMDDVGQQGKSQWRTIINFVSPVKYPLPCATASKKNTKFFSSNIILCTTNHLKDLTGFTSSDCITEPEALKRRIHLITVDAANAPGEPFSQLLKYFKYDHKVSKRWEHALLHHCASNDIPLEYRGDNIEESLSWLYRIFLHIVRREEMDKTQTVIPSTLLGRILKRSENYQYESLFAGAWQGFKDGSDMFREWIQFFIERVFDYTSWIGSLMSQVIAALISGDLTLEIKLPSFIDSDESTITMSVRSILAFAVVAIGVTYLIFKQFMSEDGEMDVPVIGPEAAFRKAALFAQQLDKYNKSQEAIWLRIGVNSSFESQSTSRIDSVRKFLKTVVVKKDQHDRSMDEELQCVVSGKYVLLPAHVDCKNVKLDLFNSYEHYKNKHVEMENVTIRLVKAYHTCDLAIYEITDAIPLYKKCWNLFADCNDKNPNMYICNSMGYFPVVLGASLRPNEDEVRYTRYTSKGQQRFSHVSGSGLLTPVSAEGLCGTVIVSASHGIIGYHVAGNDTNGFCVMPTSEIASDIRKIMLAGAENPFEIDTAVLPECSGVRLRYADGQVEVARTLNGSSLVPTIFHKSVNNEIATLISGINETQTIAPVEPVGDKIPPQFGDHPRKLLAEISKKTFKRQGFITTAERDFIAKVIDEMIIPFDDISDEECAFGGDYVGPLNKDSSNGYGCLSGKDKYFDFVNKQIFPEAYELFAAISKEASDDEYDFKHFMSRETFKDELRKTEKADTPRTFRVMPLGHIWWTKKIFGKLINHFRSTMHTHGCCVGLNPYMDFGEIYNRLKECKVTGDIDFKQWDGSVMSDIMMTIFERFAGKYTGEHINELRYVARTSTFSYVLVGDAVWSTTHGLPSGTWLTLLINCLINKAITALTLYRNKPQCTVADVFSVVDYVMGDDKIFGAPAGFEKYFNLKTIDAVATSLGMTCTNGDKTPIVREHQPLDKLTFVKRHMRRHPQLERIVGVLSLETILNTIQWCDETKDFEQAIEGKMRAVQVESYLHSKLLFDQLTCIMQRNYPFTPLFAEAQVKKILRDKHAYVQVMQWLGKDMRFIEGGNLFNQ